MGRGKNKKWTEGMTQAEGQRVKMEQRKEKTGGDHKLIVWESGLGGRVASVE